MANAHTWSSLLDDLYKMKNKADVEDTSQPLISPFIEKIEAQQLSLFSNEAKPTNLEVLFGYCVACLATVRKKQLVYELVDLKQANALDPLLAKSLNLMWDTVEVLAEEEIKNS